MSLFLISTGLGCQIAEVKKPLPRHAEQEIPKTVLFRYSWVGTNPNAIRESYTLRLLPDNRTYQSSGQQMSVPALQMGIPQVKSYQAQVPAQRVTDLLLGIAREAWTSETRPSEVIDHPDDYPNRTIVLSFSHGQTVRLFSTSNTRQGLPWNLEREGRFFVTQSSSLATEAQALYDAIKPVDNHWTATMQNPVTAPDGFSVEHVWPSHAGNLKNA